VSDAGTRLATDPAPLRAWVDELGAIGADAAGGTTRVAWSPALRAALDWLAATCARLGLAVHEDAAGNLFARWGPDGDDAVLVGSHADTVPQGGRFDGALGVLAGLEAVRLLRDAGYEPRRAIVVAAWMDEEGTRFKTPTLGSRAFAGHDLSALAGATDADGVTLADAMASWGRDVARLPEAQGVDGIAACLELHIEQGPVLEEAGVELGLVTQIAGLLGLRATFTGTAAHAGATPMGRRRDALSAAARAIVALEDWAAGREDVPVTVGIVEVLPGGFNVIPGECRFTIDVRAQSEQALDAAEQAVRAALADAAAHGGVEHAVQRTHRLAPVPLDPELTAVLARGAAREGATTLALASGAGHDAMQLAPLVPTAMLFVPSDGGLSHNPAEHTSPAACHLGARVLAHALRELTS